MIEWRRITSIAIQEFSDLAKQAENNKDFPLAKHYNTAKKDNIKHLSWLNDRIENKNMGLV